MATKLTAARQLTLFAAERFERGARCDLEAGMAKLFASEVAMEVALDAIRIHGGYGYSTEFDVERYFRDAPLMIVGEGTNEIQRNVIAQQLVERNRLPWSARDTRCSGRSSRGLRTQRTPPAPTDPQPRPAAGDVLGKIADGIRRASPPVRSMDERARQRGRAIDDRASPRDARR